MPVQEQGQRLGSDWPVAHGHVAPQPRGQGVDDPGAQEVVERKVWVWGQSVEVQPASALVLMKTGWVTLG